ncbi:hypothetical protein B0H14DRAFT_3865315 [Mycena olivaceomarginata]|nr:hypothetical protein B0H14DRAFT_3865315 [Mycena olivaceomarginata]
MHDWIPHLLLYATHLIAPITARTSPLAERYPRPIKHAQQEQETTKIVAGCMGDGKTNDVSSYALNAPFQFFGYERRKGYTYHQSRRVGAFPLLFRTLALYNTDNAFSATVGTLLGVECGDVETLASTVHAANLLRMWG